MKNSESRFSCSWLLLVALLFALPHAALAQTQSMDSYAGAVSAPIPLSPAVMPAAAQAPNNTLTDLLSHCAAVAAARGGPVPVLVDRSGKIFCGAITAAVPAQAIPITPALAAIPGGAALAARPITPALAAVPVAMPTGPCTTTGGAKGTYDTYGICIQPLCPPQLTAKCGSGYRMVPGNGANAGGCPLPAQCVANAGPCTTSGGAKGNYNGLGVCAPDICPSLALECGPNQHAEVNGGTSDDGCPLPPQCVKDASR